jgi:hypothetical protein
VSIVDINEYRELATLDRVHASALEGEVLLSEIPHRNGKLKRAFEPFLDNVRIVGSYAGYSAWTQ